MIRMKNKHQTEKNRLYFLSGRRKTAIERLKNRVYLKNKMLTAGYVANFLKLIPCIQLVGVTGGLSASNVKAGDDIDLFIIVYPNTIWISRLLVTIIVELVSRRRHPADTEVGNKICLNMFMSSGLLALSINERDLYSAHEVLQMIPLWERDKVYLNFIKENFWAEKFLPNYWMNKQSELKVRYKYRFNTGFMSAVLTKLRIFMIILCRIINPLMGKFQIWYMKNKRTSEVVSEDLLRFHPQDMRGLIRRRLRNRLRNFKIPLDKVFLGL